MTIFLTTQYLEEADELADRVGIISGGKLATEGTPTALKQMIGNDLIVAKVDGDTSLIESGLRELAGVSNVEARSGELTVSAVNGAGVIADVAVALKGSGITVQTLTLRTPTLDDVFLQVTGAHLAESHKSTGDDTEGTAS